MNFRKYRKCAASLGMTFLLLTGCFQSQAQASIKSEKSGTVVDISFEIKLEIEGDMPEDKPAFTFILEEEDGAPQPASDSVVMHGEGTAAFDEIQFTQPGAYEYSIFQRDDDLAHYTYDDTVYTIEVDVQYNKYGQLYATYTAYSESAKEIEIIFVNEYDAPSPSSEETTSEETKLSEETTVPTEETTISKETTVPDPTSPAEEVSSSSQEESSPQEEPDTTVTGGDPTESTELTEVPTSSSDDPVPTSYQSGNPGTPKTSDHTNNIPWIVLLFVTFAGAFGCIWYLIILRTHNKN